MTDMFYPREPDYDIQEFDLVLVDIEQIADTARLFEFQGYAEGEILALHPKKLEATVKYIDGWYRTTCNPIYKKIRVSIERLHLKERVQ